MLGTLLLVPALGNGLVLDDLVLKVRADPGARRVPGWLSSSPWDLFAMLPADAPAQREMAAAGTLPWWSGRGVRLAFFRPLSSATHQLDFRLWPDHPWLMHLHSLLWMLALLLALARLYGALLRPAWVAGLALLLFALDDTHAFVAGWLANRNAIVATTFVVLSLLCHHRWQQQGWRLGALLGPLCLATGLAAGEYALGAVGYLSSYALFMQRGGVVRRVRALSPYLAVVLLWALLYGVLGYGANGSDMYVDPVRTPLRFINVALMRAPALLLGQLAFPPPGLWSILPPAGQLVHSVAATVALALFGALCWPLLRRDATARFWAGGSMLAVVPICATFPHERLLLLVGMGMTGLLAQLVAHVAAAQPARGGAAWRRAAVVVLWPLLVLHLALAPLVRPLKATGSRLLGPPFHQPSLTLPGGDLAGQTLVAVNAPDAFTCNLMPVWRAALDLSPVNRLVCLGVAVGPVEVWREDAQTIRVAADGGLLDTPLGGLFRSWRDQPARVSERSVRAGVVHTVTQVTEDGRPAALRARFPVSLEDPSLRWVRWKRGAFVDFRPPPLGDVTRLDGTNLVQWMIDSSLR